MARLIACMGESGSGKTTAMRTLPPEQTYYIDADLKGLSWRGWRQQYNAEKKNYCAINDPIRVQVLMHKLSEERPNIKYIVVDTLNGIMVADEMRRMNEKGYDKWADLAACVWTIIDDALTMRDDLTIIFLCHSQTDRDDSGYMFTRIKTSGRKLLLIFRGRVCRACDKMEQTTFKDQQVKKMLENWVCLVVDADDKSNAAILEKYGIRGVPSFVLIDPTRP